MSENEEEEEEEGMNEEEFISIKNEFCKFREQLSKDIKKTWISLSQEGCYLIEGSSFEKLKEGFNKYENLKKENKIDEEFDYDNLIPDFIFINDFSSVIHCLKSNIKFKLISKKLIEMIYDEDFLKENNCIKYYSGKNKLLIEYKDIKENKSILIIDPLNENEIKKRIYIISNKADKNDISLNKLINEKDFNNESEEKYNNITIIPYEIYYNILKFFVYLYYYEKDLSNDKKEIFKDNEDYYLNYKCLVIFFKMNFYYYVKYIN